MKPEEYRQALRDLDLTQEGFADLLGHAARTGQYWAAVSVPASVASMVRLLKRRPELIDVLTDIARERKAKRK